MPNRIPLTEEALSGKSVVDQYDKGARYYMLPEYKYFAWKILRRGIKKGRVLDIGTGSGRLAIELAKIKGSDFEITGLDISGDMLQKARGNAIAAGTADKIRFIQANADALPFPDKTFDLVISYASLHHWFQPEKVLGEARRVLKDGGVMIIRDNQRVYGNPFWEAFIWVLSRFMNKRHRDNWPKAIMSSYTLPEVKAIVKGSGLKNYRVGKDFIRFDICIETPHKYSQGNIFEQ